MRIEELTTELNALKEIARFYLKLNIGAIASLFAFVSFLSATSDDAVKNAIQFKGIIGILLITFSYSMLSEYILSFYCDNKESLKQRYKKGRYLIKAYLLIWIVAIFLIAYTLIFSTHVTDVQI